MGNVTIETITYGRWGRAVRLTNGVVELVASLDFGPRIIRFGFVDGPNFFMEDAEEAIVQQGDHFAPVGGGAWKIYGGHRLWTSPEAVPRSTYPDNDPVEWKEIENGIVLTPPEERWTQLQKEIEVRMEPASGEVTVVHRVTNRGLGRSSSPLGRYRLWVPAAQRSSRRPSARQASWPTEC
ncbi:DUF4380 domain-containing protein [Paenibacillus sp. CC-CFT747]|nr:DUF4380 domain-containing protein [Paenibacillus sp. CC-CFT747]